MNEITTNTATVEDAGQWLDGAPAWTPSDAIHVDLMVYRKMICPVCKKRGGKVTPQRHCQTGAYRVLFELPNLSSPRSVLMRKGRRESLRSPTLDNTYCG